jgi:hypothetical protein
VPLEACLRLLAPICCFGVVDSERLALGPAGLVELGPPAAAVPDHPRHGGGRRREAGDGDGRGGQEQHKPRRHCWIMDT